ncbi:MAG: FmdB family zinc ribbon protein [Gallionella sp.]
MPIYAYRCSSCDCQKDVMQKMSDAPLSTCPECGKETFAKQLTAAGFQLKGSGYYVTDFKGGTQKPDAGKPDAKPDAVPVPAASTATAPVASSTA